MKKIIEGWVGKCVAVDELIEFNESGQLEIAEGYIYDDHGICSDWDGRAFPPKKVKITIEVEG